MTSPNFIKYFQDGVQFHDYYYGDCVTSYREVGNVVVPSGRIVACDPFVFPDSLSFSKQVQPGCYPVALSIVRGGSGDQRVALAMLRFSTQRTLRWKLAIL